jgi:chitin deacetylase
MKMADLNRRYREKFSFPCIVALRLHADRAAVMAEMRRRLDSGVEEELNHAIEQVGQIARGRLAKVFGT